jgi:hypothetical protein
MKNDDRKEPREPIPQKVQGNQGEVQLEADLHKLIPHNYDREQSHGKRPDFILHDDAGERVAVVDSKKGLQEKDGRSWTKVEQAKAFLKIASESKTRTLLIATEDGTDRKFSEAIKAELREQPDIPPDRKVTVVVGTREATAQKSKQLVQQANEQLDQKPQGTKSAEPSGDAKGPGKPTTRENAEEPQDAQFGPADAGNADVVPKGPAGGTAAPNGGTAPIQPPVIPPIIDIPPGGQTN